MRLKKILTVMIVFCLILGTSACAKAPDNSSDGGSTAATTKENSSTTSSDISTTSSDESESSSDVTLTLTMCGDGTNKATLDDLLSGFTDETGIKVDTIFINSGWGEYCTKVQTMIGGGEPVDCAIVAIEGVKKFISMGLATPIDDWIAQNQDVANTILNDTNKTFQDIFIDADKNVYAFPFSMNNVVMHINTTRMKAAGLELPPVDWNKEDFLAYCAALTTEVDGVKQYAIAVPYGEYFCAESWLFNNGASYMNEDLTESTINAPESVEIFQLWQDLIYKYGYAPVPEENVSAITQIINGQVAMGSWGRWPTSNYIASDFKDVAVQYLPSFKQNLQICGVDGIFTIATSKHLDEAKELAAWMSQPEFEGAYLSSGNIPALHSLAVEKITALGIPENYKVFFEDSVTASFRAVSSPVSYTECSDIVLTAISEICINQSDVQTTLDNAAAEMNEVLAENN